jgi:amino acid adenylation domain-containing protein
MFILQNTPRAEESMGGVSLSVESTTDTAAKVDLTLDMVEAGGRLTGRIEYNTDLFDASTIERMASHFRNLLEGVARDPRQNVAALPLLGEDEAERLLVGFNDTAADYECDICLHQLFEAQAARTPEATAVIFEDVALTYQQLDERANQLAHHLRSLGVGRESLVGVLLERSEQMVVSVLAVLKAGGAYVPLDPSYPHERLRFMLEDSGARVLVTQESLAELVSGVAAEVVSLDGDAALISGRGGAAVSSCVRPDNAAYVIYTSGSTGRPKGVVVSHRNVVNFLTSMAERPGLTDSDVLLSVTTLSFDIAGLEIYLPLVKGARVVIAGREAASDAAHLDDLMRRSGVTVMQATPATWRLLVESKWDGRDGLKILCGGEALPADLAARLLERCGELWNLYGPTETTIWSSVSKVTRAADSSSIGKPIANTQIYVLDALMSPVPAGVAGELYIGGDGLAHGYLNRPSLTAERFVPDPFGGDGGRLYRTGDLVRYLADGRIEFLGRIDHQVKVRGFRIELGEVEAAIRTHAAVRDCVVVVRESEGGDRRLVAYVVAEGDGASAAELRAHLKERLPDYMSPAAWVTLEELPLTPNGKVDRRALPEPGGAGAAVAREYVAPRTQVEEELARVWAQVLGVERVGAGDNFFELGGHSLLATQVMTQVRDTFGVELPVRRLFESPVLAELALAVEERQVEQADDEKLAELLAELDGLTEVEAEAMAAGEELIDAGASNE